jgi:hypothetical protein
MVFRSKKQGKALTISRETPPLLRVSALLIAQVIGWAPAGDEEPALVLLAQAQEIR